MSSHARLGPKEDGSCRSGSIFKDAPLHASVNTSMDDLCALANDKGGWASHVRSALPRLHRREKEIAAPRYGKINLLHVVSIQCYYEYCTRYRA